MNNCKYREDQIVALATSGYAGLGINIRAEGQLWALYAMDPPHYEVTFAGARTGDLFNIALAKDEFSVPANNVPISNRFALSVSQG